MNQDHILDHIWKLYHPYAETNNLFEIRCLKEGCPSPASKFFCNETGMVRSVQYASKMNSQRYNIYVIPNILKASTVSKHADDTDVEEARYHFVDSDGTDTQEILAKMLDKGFLPSFSLVTGTIPLLRMHYYWRMKNATSDLVKWTEQQKRLAQFFETDGSIHNPSRLMRLAGTVSYPIARKEARGYQPELTKLVVAPQETPQ